MSQSKVVAHAISHGQEYSGKKSPHVVVSPPPPSPVVCIPAFSGKLVLSRLFCNYLLRYLRIIWEIYCCLVCIF